MTKKFTAEDIERAAQHMARVTGVPVEVARAEAQRRAHELESAQEIQSNLNACPLILKEIAPIAESMPQYWSSRALN